MGYLSETLMKEYGDLTVRDVYSTKLGDTDVEIIEVSKDGKKFIAMFQSRKVKENLFRWSLIITSARHTRTLKGMDPLDGITLALKSSIDAMIAGMEE
ncbi:hypothetical protein [Thermococcus thioreducens]|uniref:Uncharacterized protein n=1 Tax=Thermococcus thioreducens TaxID=277988 RepID=A0A0Q2US54_9EURY|nr:hypothetical protein [Thermococcus thioreducens]ASJ11421.1 hypothetical protein A3L14_00315 [Thermococcus thioreducens]KQH83440.1 hypothetical protein AMR53_00320 [Thermococcus thioreducens]SEW07021.1 hypothetical protein SAMN05216170_1376 [Thermococcus thioreducens]